MHCTYCYVTLRVTLTMLKNSLAFLFVCVILSFPFIFVLCPKNWPASVNVHKDMLMHALGTFIIFVSVVPPQGLQMVWRAGIKDNNNGGVGLASRQLGRKYSIPAGFTAVLLLL